MVKGVVKSFNKYRGYGFITIIGDYRDVIVHYSVIMAKGFKNLVKNQKVLLEYKERDGLLCATKVIAVKSVKEN